MQKVDVFDELLSKKIRRLEQWSARLEKQVKAIQQDLQIVKGRQPKPPSFGKIEQLNLFGA